MKKKLLAAAVAGALAVPGVAMAVEVFGTVDTGLRSQSKVVTTGTETGNLMTVTDGERTTNRWGFRGSEDLGGGLMTNYWFEGQFGSDTGALGSSPAQGAGTNTQNQGLFQRKMLVGLSKSGMSIDLGRDYTVNFKTQGIYDPMSYTYTGITPSAGLNTAGVRSSNLVTAGFRFGTGGIRLDYALGEVTDNTSSGSRYGINGDFAIGSLTLAAAVSSQKQVITPALGDLKTDTANFGGAWVLGGFTLRLGYSETTVKADATAAELKTPLLLAGVQYAFSPTLNGRVGYYDNKFKANGTEVGSRKLAIVALDYYLSKRTTMYVAFDHTSITGQTGTISASTGAITISGVADQGTVLGVNSASGTTGVSVGLAHSF
ncbi:MAG: porin [Burkholderiales bacterium]